MNREKVIKIVAIIMGVILFFSAGFFLYQASLQKLISLNQKTEKIESEKTDVLRETLPSENNKEEPGDREDNPKLLVSENYKIEQVRFGGDVSIVIDDAEKLAIEIGDVYSESFVAKKDKEAKLVIFWKTNKLTNSEIEYARSDGQEAKTIKENGYGFTHSVILPNLEPGKAYIFRIKSVDRWGNAKTSDYYGAYVSSRPISIFEMMGKAMQEIFGWAIK